MAQRSGRHKDRLKRIGLGEKTKCACGGNEAWQQRVQRRRAALAGVRSTNSYVPYVEFRNQSTLVHDNGGRPFVLREEGGRGLAIYTYGAAEDDDDGTFEQPDDERFYEVLVKRYRRPRGYWRGFDSSAHEAHGNSALIQLDAHRYVSVGSDVIEFATSDDDDDVIVDYVSPLGPNDVPYPVAFGTNHVYFLGGGVASVPRTLLKTPVTVQNAEDLYMEFYGHLPQARNFNAKWLRDAKTVAERR